MIRLTDEQYAAIGKVAVQSGTLDRELGEYLVRLRTPRYKSDVPLGVKRTLLHGFLAGFAGVQVAFNDFDFALSKIEALVDRRNAVAHGTWSDASNAPTTLGEVTVQGRRQRCTHAMLPKWRRSWKSLVSYCFASFTITIRLLRAIRDVRRSPSQS